MPDVAFVAAPAQDQLIHELAATLVFELGRQGVLASAHLGRFPSARPDRVFVLLNPREYVALMGPEAIPSDSVLRRTVFACVEPPPADAADPHLELLSRAGAVFAFDRRHVAALHRLGVAARLLRPGYSEALDHFDPEAQRAIDIMVLGEATPRRTRYLSRAAPILARHNCLIQLAAPGPHPHDTTSYLGAGRWPLLARTKVLLNLHGTEDDRGLEWGAVLDAIHAGAVVVSEHATGIVPLEVGQHLLVAAPEALADAADLLLRDPDRLAALRRQAYERLSTWIPYALPVSVLRAAIVELVGEPLTDDDLGTGTGGTAQDIAPGAGDEPAPPRVPDASLARPVTGPPRDSVLPPGAVTDESPGWSTRRAPRVSVVCALAGDAEEVATTLGTVTGNRMRDLEVIAVHPAPATDAASAAAAWLRDHPRLAARVISVNGEAGTGTLRQVAAAVARAPHCLILDGGQSLFPRALDVLAGTLEAAVDADFTYPIHTATGAAGGEQLGNVLGWDSERERAEATIRAPLLIRTDVLRALRGSATGSCDPDHPDRILIGALADRGACGQLVPQILARRATFTRG